MSLMNFIDRQFVLDLFNEKRLLHRIYPVLEKIVESLIPKFEVVTKTFGPFYKSQQDCISRMCDEDPNLPRIDLRDSFESQVKEATNKNKELRENEDREIEKQVKVKMTILTEFLASDVFILLPSDLTFEKKDNNEKPLDESIQEIIATRISLSVYNHIKQYKNQYLDLPNQRQTIVDKVKDTTASEIQYLMLYQMSVFEKKYNEHLLNKISDELKPSHFSVLVNNAMPDYVKSSKNVNQTYAHISVTETDDFEIDLLNGLAFAQPQQQPVNQLLAESKEEANVKSQNPLQENPQFANTPKVEEQKQEESVIPAEIPNNEIKSRRTFQRESLQLGLGAKKDNENGKDRQEKLWMLFESGRERRLCFFLNETEDIIAKYGELKDNSQYLQVAELAEKKKQYTSLFSVLVLQHLTNLTQNSFTLLYSKRPGCLDRLIKQVRTTATTLEFSSDEFFFSIKKLQVIEQFCKNVIETLCEAQNKKFIEEMQDKYTYKSIVSQVWVLQFMLLALQAEVLYEFQLRGAIMKELDTQFNQNVQDFNQRLQTHAKTQNYLWSTYREVDDIILPEDRLDLYTGIQGKIIKILRVDLDDTNLETIDKQKLLSVLRPLALMFVQIDELTFKTQSLLSYRVFAQAERLLKEIIEHGQQSIKDFDKHTILKNKKRQICDFFCEQYKNAIATSDSKDSKFKIEIKQRLEEMTQMKTLYLRVIEFESNNYQKGNLLAQLISYYELMTQLQDKNLTDSFRNNINIKYKSMIEKIDKALYKAFQDEKQKAIDDEDYICQMQESQYKDQMKEVKAFMYVQVYNTYRNTLEQGLLSEIDSKQHVIVLEAMITNAVELLVPEKNQTSSKDNAQNQFFDVALKLLSHKRELQESNFNYVNVIQTLEEQSHLFKMYDQTFERKEIYCNYYRVKMESFLPEEMQVKDRHFIYRTPSGYNQEFIKNDLGILLGTDKIKYSKDCDVKPVKPLTKDIRLKYNILPNTKNLSETPEELKECPLKYKEYFRQNFKKQFYIQQCPSTEPAGFDEEEVITIYEVKQTFPTMTMVQEVFRVFERRVPRVKIQLWSVQMILLEIQNVMKNQNKSTNKEDQKEEQKDKGKDKEATTLDDLIQKYVTNDDVGGGLPKIIELFFSESQCQSFNELENIELKRAYLELFKGLEKWLNELVKVVELYAVISRNSEMTKLAEERLEDRQKLLNQRRKEYNLHKLQENF